VYCSVLLRCSVLLCVAAWCSVLQCGGAGVLCGTLSIKSVPVSSEAHVLISRKSVLFISMSCVAVCCSVLQCVAVCCSALQCGTV